MATKWIDFSVLKREVPIRDVLSRYGFLEGLSEKKAGKLSGPCPIHGGGPNSNSFHVDLRKNVWNCFSACKAGGNVLDLVMKVERCTIREAAEKLATWFDLSFDRKREVASGTEAHRAAGRGAHDTPTESSPAAAAHEQRVNVPLERPLSGLNADHAYLVSRGLTMPTIKHFGIGYCVRGLMRGRIAIPIHDERGELVAYAGRAVEEKLAAEHGKYRLPTNFSKNHVVWNLNRAREHAKASGLIVVEGFFGAMRVHQAGFPNVVALMGSAVSDEQEQLLLAHTDRLALMFDGDDAGVGCLRDFYRRLRRRMYLREVHLEPGEQPDGLTEDRIRCVLAGQD